MKSIYLVRDDRTLLLLALFIVVTFSNTYDPQTTTVFAWLSDSNFMSANRYNEPRRRHSRVCTAKILRIHTHHVDNTRLSMVRNIDLPEAVIFYGTKTIIPSYVSEESDEDAIQRFRAANILGSDNLNDDDTTVIKARTGLSRFFQECHDIGTAVIVLLDRDDDDDPDNSIDQQFTRGTNNYVLDAVLPNKISRPCIVFTQTRLPPDPTDLLTILNTLMVQPRPYGSGGMTTIGYQGLAEPERLLAPRHCVVFTTTIQQTRVARALGMRVVTINNFDDHLADAALLDPDYDSNNRDVTLDLSIDDIATPGSYWLNPPHPRDDEGNQVSDPYDLLKQPSKTSSMDRSAPVYQDFGGNNDDDDLRAILADIAPLKRI